MALNSDGSYSFRQYDEVEDKPYVYKLTNPTHLRYVLPKQMNAISYSLPWVTQQMIDIISSLFNLVLDQATEVLYFVIPCYSL